MSRVAVRPPASHVKSAARVRQLPGVWLPVGRYRARYNAQSIARQVEIGALRSYLPAGSFQARVEPVGDETGVFIRYVVKPPPPITVSPFLLAWLVVRICDLSDALAAARETVAAQQAECPRRSS